MFEQFLVVSTCQRELEVLIGLVHHVDGSEHVLQGAFVHGDVGDFEPSLFLQVLGKRLEHAHPELFVSRFARLAVEVLELVAGLVEVLEAQAPRHHGVAVDFFLHTARHHEFHPLVEHGIVEPPSAVGLLHPGHHAFERIVGLAVPRLVHDGCSNHLTTRLGIALHDRAHQVEMFLAERLYIVIACHGIRILPQVEVEGPVLRFRQHTVFHRNHQRKLCQDLTVFLHGYIATVHALDDVFSRDAHAYPYRLGSVLLDVECRGDMVDDIGHEGRIPIGLVETMATTALAVLVQLVGHDIAHEASLGVPLRNLVVLGHDVAHFHAHVLQVAVGRNHELGCNFLAHPSGKVHGSYRSDRRWQLLVVTHIGASPSDDGFSNSRPLGGVRCYRIRKFFVDFRDLLCFHARK